MKVGYARISTEDQKLDVQIDALKNEGCEKIYTDVTSGSKAHREGLTEAMSYIREGDTLVVWKLDRLGRSIRHLIETMDYLKEKKIMFKCLQENIDTETSMGKFIFHVFSALAEFERDLIRERTFAGLRAARARGRLGGRPFMLEASKAKRMIDMYDQQKNTVGEICKIYDVSSTSFYNYYRRHKELTVKVKENK